MRAVVICGDGDRTRLRLAEVPDPEPGPRELLVRVRAAALNRADLSQRRGRYRQQATAKDGPRIGGLEGAGEVVAVGSDVTRFRPGDRVMSQCAGSYAELLTIDERLPIPVPARMSWEEAAATPVGVVTAHDALKTNAELTAGATVLVRAADSAVGLAAVQVARCLGAGLVFGTVGSPEKAEFARSLGLDVAIVRGEAAVPDVVASHTEGRGVDIVIDHVGGPVLAENMRMLAVCGRLVSVGRLGAVTGALDLDQLALKRLRLIGVTFRTRTLDEYGDCVRSAVTDLLPALADGRLRPVVDSVFSLDEVARAQERMARNLHLGKIIIRIEGTG